MGLALAAALLLAPALRASEPSVSVDERVELDASLGPLGPKAPMDARAQIVMRLGPLPELDAKAVPDALLSGIGTPAETARWLDALRALARSSATADALTRERRELAPAEEGFRARLSSGAFVARIQDYAGLPLPGTHRVYLSPAHAAGGIANVVADAPDGTVAVSSLLGPDRSGGRPEYWTLRVPGTLWHEEAHGILDPLAVAWSERIERARPADAAAVCYGDWRQCAREHVVRAVMIRLIERHLGPRAAAEQLAFENPARFRWLVPMIERLKEYESDRARWPTLADFYPRLLDAVRPEDGDPAPAFLPNREPSAVRARLVLLARTALPRMKDEAAKRHLAAALALAETGTELKTPSVSSAATTGEDAAAGALTQRGVAAFQAGRTAEALDFLDQALRRDPDDAEASLSRGVVLEALGRIPEARASYERAVESAKRRKDFPPHVLADAQESAGRLKPR